MPSFCPRCGEFVEAEACAKCGEKAVAPKENPWKSAAKAPGGDGAGVPAVPTAFTAAARIKMMGAAPVPEPVRKEKATVLFNFVPQDAKTQLRLTKDEEVDVVRKDSDGWWFVIKDGEKGLVPGTYLHIANPILPVTDAAMLSAREASNQRFLELSRSSGGSSAQDSEAEYQPTSGMDALGLGDSAPPPIPKGPPRADAKAGDAGFKPGEVRKLKKCFACKETILGRTKVCQHQLFHEICLLCKGCREPIEEEEEFMLIKKKAYHLDCGKDVNHCYVCDKEILGRVYRAGDGAFHKLCMLCSVCNKQAKEAGSKLENDLLVCGECVAEKERKEKEEREARLAAERAAAKAKAEKEAALAAARALEEKKEREAREALEAKKAAEEAARAKAEAEAAAAARAQAEAEAAKAEELQKAAAAAVASNRYGQNDNRQSSTSNLDEFDLEATPIDTSGQNGRVSEVSDLDSVLDSDGEYGSYMGVGGRDSLRLSEVLDMESVNEFNDRRSTLREEQEQEFSEDDEDREMCGGCGLVLEGEAVGALNQYFHYECFKCSHCRRVIAEDDGYAEKDNMAFHQNCYQARFGKKCHRCEKVLKGKVVKALDHLYHPGCFVCFKCSSSLQESFFEHDGQAVCAKCKHEAIAYAEPTLAENLVPVAKGIAGYRFDAQDDTQLTIYPGDEVAILQKDDDGWWLAELRNKRGYVPGSYLIERPIDEPKKKSKSSSKPKPKPKAKSKPKRQPGMCSECSTQNPAEARFCRTCGNNLMA